MINRIHLCVSIVICLKTFTYAQDLHFTNNRTVSNFFNPAQNGDFQGFIKFQAASRTQYDESYEHTTLGGQVIFESPFSSNHWIAGAINLSKDLAGDLKLGFSGGGLGLAYHMMLGKNQKSIFSAGAAMDRFTLTADDEKYLSERIILNLPDPDRIKLINFDPSIFSINFGLAFKYKFSKKSEMQSGISIMHANQPKFLFNQGQIYSTIGNRINLNGSLKTAVTNQITLNPAFYYSLSEHHSNINLQLLSELKLKAKNQWQMVFGTGYRIGESIDFIAGYSSPKMYVTCSFDLLISSLANPLNHNGAMELGAFYIINRRATPKLIPEVICPRL